MVRKGDAAPGPGATARPESAADGGRACRSVSSNLVTGPTNGDPAVTPIGACHTHGATTATRRTLARAAFTASPWGTGRTCSTASARPPTPDQPRPDDDGRSRRDGRVP